MRPDERVEMKALIVEALNEFGFKPYITETTQQNLLTQKEVLDKFSISKSTLCYWQKNLNFPFVKINRRIFYKKEDVETFLNSYTKSP